MFPRGRRPKRGPARKTHSRKTFTKPRKIVVESLEPRLLLSSVSVVDGVLTADLNAGPDIVQIVQQAVAEDGGVIIDLTVNGTTTTYGDSSTGIQSLKLSGLAGADSFTFASPVDVPIEIDGGADADTIIGPNTDTEWTLTGANAGHTNGDLLIFTNVETITGGTAQDNYILLGGSLTGTISGGGGEDS